jgi:hypothetical protein
MIYISFLLEHVLDEKKLILLKNKLIFKINASSLPPGKHYYKFVVDGEWMIDPNIYLQ